MEGRVDVAVIGAGLGRCRLIANFGVGVNHIDVPAATRAGMTGEVGWIGTVIRHRNSGGKRLTYGRTGERANV